MSRTFGDGGKAEQVKTLPTPPCVDLQRVCAGEAGIRGGREAADGAGFDGEDGHFELFAAVGKIDGDGCKGGTPGVDQEKCLVIVASPSERQSQEFLGKCEEFAEKLQIKARGDGRNAISLAFPKGSRIVGLPGRADTVRGFSASLVLIDEASRVTDEIYSPLGPMRAATNGACG